MSSLHHIIPVSSVGELDVASFGEHRGLIFLSLMFILAVYLINLLNVIVILNSVYFIGNVN